MVTTSRTSACAVLCVLCVALTVIPWGWLLGLPSWVASDAAVIGVGVATGGLALALAAVTGRGAGLVLFTVSGIAFSGVWFSVVDADAGGANEYAFAYWALLGYPVMTLLSLGVLVVGQRRGRRTQDGRPFDPAGLPPNAWVGAAPVTTASGTAWEIHVVTDDKHDDGSTGDNEEPVGVRLMNEYGGHLPLWLDDPDADVDELELSDGLCADLMAFAERWVSWNEPEVSDDRWEGVPVMATLVTLRSSLGWLLNPARRREAGAFWSDMHRTGEELAVRVQDELGPAYRVRYVP